MYSLSTFTIEAFRVRLRRCLQ